jgi:hypothetical protein
VLATPVYNCPQAGQACLDDGRSNGAGEAIGWERLPTDHPKGRAPAFSRLPAPRVGPRSCGRIFFSSRLASAQGACGPSGAEGGSGMLAVTAWGSAAGFSRRSS